MLDGPINGDCNRLSIKTALIPTLQPRDIVLIENFGSHKSKAMRRAIRAAVTALLFLPK